jgi:hypothetical protein
MPIVFVGMFFEASANLHGHEAVTMPPARLKILY